MKKVLIRTRYVYPLYHFGDGVYLRQKPAEVTLDEWTQAQIDGGLLVVEAEGGESEAKPQARGRKAESKE